MLNKQQEKVLKFLLSLPRDIDNTVSVSNSMCTIPSSISETEFITILNSLEQNGFLELKWINKNHENLNNYVTITILNENYFIEKSANKRKNLKDNIKWIITLIISILSLVWNICNTIMYSYLKDYLLNK
jgi:hypothetical protein